MISESTVADCNSHHSTDEATRKERYQLENELEEKLMVSKLTQYERIIIGAVRRDTLMFNHRVWGISVTRFECLTRLHRRSISNILKQLVKKRVLNERKRGKISGSRYRTTEWGIHFPLTDWQVEEPASSSRKGTHRYDPDMEPIARGSDRAAAGLVGQEAHPILSPREAIVPGGDVEKKNKSAKPTVPAPLEAPRDTVKEQALERAGDSPPAETNSIQETCIHCGRVDPCEQGLCGPCYSQMESAVYEIAEDLEGYDAEDLCFLLTDFQIDQLEIDSCLAEESWARNHTAARLLVFNTSDFDGTRMSGSNQPHDLLRVIRKRWLSRAMEDELIISAWRDL